MELGWRLWLLPLLITLVFLLITFVPTPRIQHGLLRTETTVNKKTFHAPRHNIWSELSQDEAANVDSFVASVRPDLNLTGKPELEHGSFIYSIETLRPNKTDATPYIYGNGSEVERWARVTISESFPDGEHSLFLYRVGPLPISNKTEMLPLDYAFNNGKNYVHNPAFNFHYMLDFGVAFGANISDITRDLLDAEVNPEDAHDPKALRVLPRISKVEFSGLKLWMQYFRAGAADNSITLLPQGLFVRIDATNPDKSQWSAEQFYYNGILYDNEKAFRAAWKSSGFNKPPTNLDGEWTWSEENDSLPYGRRLNPPLPMQPFGPRYRFDADGRFVSWFGFEFYVATSAATGVSLHDIRFKGERIIYELSLQEVLSHSAGNDPTSGAQAVLDSFFGLGSRSFELVPGYDCPAYADYIDLHWHSNQRTHETPNSICLFEFTADYLLSRHTAEYSVTASRNTFLVIRSVSTIGNYDYTFEYVFYLDGTIEVKVRTSGYIFGETFNFNNGPDEYGYRVHDALLSSATDHIFNFKADLDVAGPTNEVVKLTLEPQTTSYDWDKPDGIDQRNTMHLKEYKVSQETALDWPRDAGEHYNFYSSEKNAWGERKGYRLAAGSGAGITHLTVQNSTQLGKMARWAERDMWLLRHKDNETRSADPLNWAAPHDPPVDFSKMANNESLTDPDHDGDLVLYFNLGLHHVPTSSDIPSILQHTSTSSVMFVPHNFHDRDPSRESTQGVRLALKGSEDIVRPPEEGGNDPRQPDLRKRKDKRTYPHYFGQSYEEDFELTLDDIEPNLEMYQAPRNRDANSMLSGAAVEAQH